MRGSGRIPHLFTAWKGLEARVRLAKHIALLLDFDGTLAALRPHPAQVWLPPASRGLLARLARRPSVTVAIISGRTLDDVRHRAGVAGVRYLGLHGWETEGQSRSGSKRSLRRLRRIQQAVSEKLHCFSGLWLEDKKYGFVVHFRGADPRTVSRAGRIFRKTLRPYRDDFRLLLGKKIWEVLPRDIPGKGAAAKALLSKLPHATLPIYIGDDRTDEDAFRALRRRGVTVRVGQKARTRAQYWLRDPKEVQRFLRRLEGLCRGRMSHSAS